MIPDLKTAQVQAFLGKLRKHDLHLEMHLEGHRLATHIAQFADQGLKLVIDHFGLPSDTTPASDRFINALRNLEDNRNVFIKLSAPYRTHFDIMPHLECLRDLLSPDQTVWCSDWPHTQHENIVDYDAVYSDAARSFGVCDTKSVEVLYGIAAE